MQYYKMTFSKTAARKTVKKYMATAATWSEFKYIFLENIEREANGRPAKWESTPSIEASNAWENIKKRHGVI